MTQDETASIDVTPDKDGGVLKEILREGSGDEFPQTGDKVYVHYVGTLTDGTGFDSSRERDEKFSFNLGKGSVIKAWDLGVATMKKGELARLTCKPEYAYGTNGSPPKIGPNATLIFEVELFEWKKEDISPNKDEGILRRIVKNGEGRKTPNEGATVNVHYIGYHENKQFEERDVTFVVGEGMAEGVIDGLDMAMKKMNENEQSILEIAPKYAYGKEGHSEFNIPPNATLKYDVTLKSFQKDKETWEMDADEKLQQAEIAKEKGTKYFKEEKYTLAIKQYKKIVNYLDTESSLEGAEEEKRHNLLLAAHLNISLCHLKTGEHVKAIQASDKALELDDKNVKGLFRRGQAKLKVNEYEDALFDFNTLLKYDAENKAAKNHVIMCTKKIKEYKAKEKQLYANIFNKCSMETAKNEESKSSENKPSPPVEEETADVEEAVNE